LGVNRKEGLPSLREITGKESKNLAKITENSFVLVKGGGGRPGEPKKPTTRGKERDVKSQTLTLRG